MGAGQPPTVLIAEDEEPIAIALSFIIEDAGFHPLIARHGRQALELARVHHPAVVLTDYMMPQMNGIELIAALRSEHLTSLIILMSAAGAPVLATAGADVVLAKPFEMSEIESLLRGFLAAH